MNKHVTDIIAFFTTIGSFVATVMHFLPIIATFVASAMAALWYGSQWYWTRKDRKAKGL